MDSLKSSVLLNLSNQANTGKAKNSSLSQFNFFVILGLDFIDIEEEGEDKMPVSVSINKLGELTLGGLDGELVNDSNVQVYSDKKVTNSQEK